MSGRRGSSRALLLTARAFLRIGYVDAMAYPLTLVLSIAQPLTNILLYFYLAKLVDADQALVGGDYFTYAVVGVLVLRVLGAGLEEFGLFVQRTIDQGQLELYLVQPVGSTILPFVWFEWPLVLRLMGGGATVSVALAMGTRFETDRLLLVAVVLALGISATHAIGVVAASVRILAKRADPVLLLYTVATSVFSGLFVPVQVLPGPLQVVSWAIPHTYVVDALRQLLLDGPDAGSRISIERAIAALLLFTAVTYGIGLWMFNRSLTFARRHGLVGAY